MRIGTKFIVRAFAAAALSLGIASLSVTPAFAKYAAFVIDADTGEVHHDVNSTTRNYPASLTKLMTLYLLFEAIDRHEVNLDTKLKISRKAARQPPSKLGVRAGDTITVKQAILALIVKSANDVAVVISENLAKSERAFALKMTAKARELGMKDTTFRNASGLPNRGQMTTARDMALLAKDIIERFPHFYEYFSTPSFTYKGTTFPTHNKMLGHYDGLDGLKTGYIHASGFNLVTSAEREDHRLIGVVFGGKTPRSRDRHMANMLDDAFDEIANENPEEQGSADPPPMPPLPRQKPQIASAEIAKPIVASSDGSIWGVQVGAYYSQKPAFEAAERALSKLPDLLEDGTVAVMPLKKSRGRVLYRARILGIQKKAAYRACYQFKKLSVPCLELRISAGAFDLARNKD